MQANYAVENTAGKLVEGLHGEAQIRVGRYQRE
jgi:hypothetical protein